MYFCNYLLERQSVCMYVPIYVLLIYFSLSMYQTLHLNPSISVFILFLSLIHTHIILKTSLCLNLIFFIKDILYFLTSTYLSKKSRAHAHIITHKHKHTHMRAHASRCVQRFSDK